MPNPIWYILQVISAGTTEGPENVLVNLESETDKTVKFTALTREGGDFLLAPVLPEKYLLTATCEKYKFLKNSIRILVNKENLQVPINSLVIAGYDVNGQVLFNGEPTVGVSFVLSANDEVS